MRVTTPVTPAIRRPESRLSEGLPLATPQRTLEAAFPRLMSWSDCGLRRNDGREHLRMRTAMALATACLLVFVSFCRAESEQQKALQEIHAVERLLKTDPKAALKLAKRIARSRLGARISLSKNSLERTKEIEAWLLQHSEEAAAIGVGLARDDAKHDHHFENRLDRQLSQLEPNPGAVHNTFNRLKRSSRDLRAMHQDATMSNEERVEILNTLFEGQGSGSHKVIRRKFGASSSDSPATSLAGNFYNRLSLNNLAGYSPNVAALQSQMNRWHVPNAPALPETGYLGYPTLAYPGYAMAYDIANLKARLNLKEAYALAQKLGISISAQEVKDPSVLSDLVSKAKDKGIAIPNDYQIQAKTISNASRALDDFNLMAQKSKDPKQITPQLLISLGAKQRDASRWISAAFLEQDINRIEEKERLLSPDLKAAIAACPVSPQEKAEYLQRGQGYFEKMGKLNEDNFKALDDLLNHWPQKSAEANALMQDGAQLRTHLAADVDDFVAVPYRLASLLKPEPRWKNWLNDAARRFLSWTAYAQKLEALEEEKSRLKGIFLSIAVGDQTAARRMLHPQ